MALLELLKIHLTVASTRLSAYTTLDGTWPLVAGALSGRGSGHRPRPSPGMASRVESVPENMSEEDHEESDPSRGSGTDSLRVQKV